MRFLDKQAGVLQLISRYFPCQSLISAVNDSKIGLVVCDRSLRYRAVNQSLAEMHNVPIEGHLGHSFHQVLGSFTEKVAPFWESVLATGQPVTNLEVIGKLPKRPDTGRWVENLFPLKDDRGRIAQVGCIVIETALRPTHHSPRLSTTCKEISVTVNQPSSPDRGQRTPLSNREQEILRLLAEGKSNKEISSVLGISVRTVETHRSRLMLKLQATSIVHLVHYAIRNHILTL